MERYSRHSILPEVGEIGQKAISKAAVLCVGVGGLGSPALLYLAAAGVGRIGMIDGDLVSVSNLQRQILFEEGQKGEKKVFAAMENLRKLNSDLVYEAHSEMLSAENVEGIFSKYDIILDGTDNFQAKYLINDAAVKLKKPVVFGSVTALEGQVTVFDSDRGPCYRCLYPKPAMSAIPNCAENGVLGPLVGMIGSMQAMECLKLIVSKVHPTNMQPMIGRLFSVDARDLSVMNHQLSKNPNCIVCSAKEVEIVAEQAKSCGFQIPRFPLSGINGEYVLIDVREKEEWEEGHHPDAIHLPLSEILNDDFELQIHPKKKKIVYCKSGVRSLQAIQILQKKGFTNLHNLSEILPSDGTPLH